MGRRAAELKEQPSKISPPQVCQRVHEEAIRSSLRVCVCVYVSVLSQSGVTEALMQPRLFPGRRIQSIT